MALLKCARCGAQAEADTFEQADSLIDHSVGIMKGWPCTGNPEYLVWSGNTKTSVYSGGDKQVLDDKPSQVSKKSSTNTKKTKAD